MEPDRTDGKINGRALAGRPAVSIPAQAADALGGVQRRKQRCCLDQGPLSSWSWESCLATATATDETVVIMDEWLASCVEYM